MGEAILSCTIFIVTSFSLLHYLGSSKAWIGRLLLLIFIIGSCRSIFQEEDFRWDIFALMILTTISGFVGFFSGQADKRKEEEREKKRREQKDISRKHRTYDEINKEPDEYISRRATEEIAMEQAMIYEENNGRTPRDASLSNLGYDIESSGNWETRYIEVKGLSDSFSNSRYIIMTENEWLAARILKDKYWLYVVFNCGGYYPEIYKVNNPAYKLNASFSYSNKKYVINAGDIATNS